MAEHRFIKLIDSERSQWLQENHPWAFLLLITIAKRARRIPNSPDGCEIGECHIGDYKNSGIPSEKTYRTAKDVLVREKIIKICETCRNRKKGATGRATLGTKVKLLSSDIYDINPEIEGDRKGDRRATEGRPNSRGSIMYKNDKNDKKEKEITTTKPPSFSASADCVFVFHGPFVKLKPADYEKLCAEKGKAVIDGLIVEMNDYCLSTHTKGYKDYAAALRQWCRRRSAPMINGFNKTVDRRTKDVNGTPVSSPHDGRF